jgi:hypothetical protein
VSDTIKKDDKRSTNDKLSSRQIHIYKPVAADVPSIIKPKETKEEVIVKHHITNLTETSYSNTTTKDETITFISTIQKLPTT